MQLPSNAGSAAVVEGGGEPPRLRYAKLGKDPTVRTDFLPDKDREREEEELREKLKVCAWAMPWVLRCCWARRLHPELPLRLWSQAEFALRQAAIKAEPLEIIYSYYNGTGHRRAVTVRKGDTVGQFLKAVVEQLTPQFREIRWAA